MRQLLALPLLLVACGPPAEGPRASARVEEPASSAQRPAPSAQPPAANAQRPAPSGQPPAASAQPPAPSAEPAVIAPPGPIDERFSDTRDGWRVDYRLRLPELPADISKRMRFACTAWLFQGLAQPRASIKESGEAALATLINDVGKPGGADAWYSERSVIATHQGGGWLALRRSERSFAGGANPTARVEGLVVELDGARALTIDEIVPPDRQAGLRLALAAVIRRDRKLPAEGPLTSEVANDAELPIPVPLISGEGARFVWNPFEIGPFSDGPYEVELPAERLRGVFAVDPWKPRN